MFSTFKKIYNAEISEVEGKCMYHARFYTSVMLCHVSTEYAKKNPIQDYDLFKFIFLFILRL